MRRLMIVAAGAVLAVCSAIPAGASTGWTVQPTPNPPGVQDSYLDGVTCTPANECMAVGGYYQAATGDEFTLAESFNGSTWAIVPTPNVGSDSELAGVACASATSCIAVGSSGGGSAPLVEDWNGSTWTIQAVPGAGALNEIKCFGSTSCVAVGTGSGSLPLIESWNGTKWTVQSTPAASPGQLYGVSCVTPASCFAAGTNGFDEALGVRLPGGPPRVNDRPRLAQGGAAKAGALFEHWNGTKWSAQVSPAVPKLDGQSPDLILLSSIGCFGSDCTAVGYVNYPGSETPESSPWTTLIERWNGKKWTIQKSLNPDGESPGFDFLYAARCVSATSCTAAGVYGDDADGSPGLPLVEHWNGSKWTQNAAADPSEANGLGSGFEGLTCPSATTCTAVGITSDSSDDELTLAERN